MMLNLEPVIRFMQHLPRNGDVELSLLKCHLLVEEVLTKLIERNLRHPNHLRKARLNFFQKMCMARSLNDLEGQAWIWGALKRLNEARNALAHGLEADEIQRKLEAFILFVEAEEGAPNPKRLGQAFGRFQWAAFKVFAPLAAHAHLDISALRIPTLLTGGDEQGPAADRSGRS